MNLELKHFPPIALGIAVGAGLGWLASFLIPPGVFPAAESSLGLRWSGAMLGAIAGLGIAAVALVVKGGRDPKVGPARYFMRIHGMGSTFIGHSEPRDDGSYVTTEWFTMLWLPIFPVCRYRVTKHLNASTPFCTPYTIHEKMPARLGDAARVYRIAVAILFGIVGITYLILR